MRPGNDTRQPWRNTMLVHMTTTTMMKRKTQKQGESYKEIAFF